MNNREFIKEKFKKLPADLQSAIISADYGKKVAGIGKNYQLNAEKILALENEVTFVMLGLIPPSIFTKNIEEKVGVSSELAHQVAQKVNEIIFRPVRESLRKINDISEPRNPAPKFVIPPVPQKPEDETKLNREEILAGIENPAPTLDRAASLAAKASSASNLGTENIVQNKLEGMVRMPLSEEEVRITNNEVSENKEGQEKKYGVDPYREPIK